MCGGGQRPEANKYIQGEKLIWFVAGGEARRYRRGSVLSGSVRQRRIGLPCSGLVLCPVPAWALELELLKLLELLEH